MPDYLDARYSAARAILGWWMAELEAMSGRSDEPTEEAWLRLAADLELVRAMLERFKAVPHG